MSADDNKFEERLKAIEDKLKLNKEITKKPRKPSEYNNFVGKYISENSKNGKKHSEVFSEGTKAWNEHKEKLNSKK